MNARKKVTIKDIAKHANVSVSTVSRVINDPDIVTENKRLAVLEAIRELNYKPNIFAQGLASGQSMVVGVLIPRISTPVFASVMEGANSHLTDSGYVPFFVEAGWTANSQRRAVEKFLDRRVDGLMLLWVALSDDYIRSLADFLPTVLVGNRVEGITCLEVDNYTGAYQATKYLIDAGHRDIAHVAGLLEQKDARDRLRGYKDALNDAGLPADEDLIVDGAFHEQSGKLAIEMLIARGKTFSAIFSSNDQMAFGIRLGLFRRGLRVPDDVSLIGFDDQGAAAYMTPPLTTVRQPATEIGEAAANGLLKLIDGQEVDFGLMNASLIIRESVANNRM